MSFEGDTLEDAITALGVMMEKESDKAFIPNFVLNDPDGTIKDNPVSLRLRNIPATVALKSVSYTHLTLPTKA